MKVLDSRIEGVKFQREELLAEKAELQAMIEP